MDGFRFARSKGCGRCNSTGRVTITSSVTYFLTARCSSCEGTGVVHLYTPDPTYSARPKVTAPATSSDEPEGRLA